MHLLRQGRKSYLVTSCWEGEGKSTVCINLAAALSEFGFRVLLVDGDLRQRSLTRLLLKAPIAALNVQRTEWIPNVRVVGAFLEAERTAADTLSAPGYRQFLDSLFPGYDLILMDSPPLAACADALLIGRWLDGALIVSSQQTFRGIPEGHFSEDLRENGVDVVGVVLTGSK